MSKSIIRPKAALLWNEQTEKLKQKLSAFTDFYFEKEKMEEMIQRLRGKVGKTDHELLEMTKL